MNDVPESQGDGLEIQERTDRRVRADVNADDLLNAVANLSRQDHNEDPDRAGRMITLLVAGLRYGEPHA